MKRILAPLLLLLSLLATAPSALAQTTVTVDLKSALGTAITSSAEVRFRLWGIGGNVPRLNGTGACASAVLLNSEPDGVLPNGSGLVSTTLCGNDIITPANTRWVVEYWLNGEMKRTARYNITGPSADLNTLAADVSTPANTTLNAVLTNPTGGATQNVNGALSVTGQLAAATQFKVIGAASQSGPLFDVQTSAGTPKFRFTFDNSLVLGGTVSKQVSGGPELISAQDASASKVVLTTFVGSEANARFIIDMQGNHEWGMGGANDQSVLLGISAAGRMNLSGESGGGFNIVRWTSPGVLEAQPRVSLNNNGDGIKLSDGSTAADIQLYRSAANIFNVATTGDGGFGVLKSADSFHRFFFDDSAGGGIKLGNGSSASELRISIEAATGAATAGTFRLANTETIRWRNAANNANISLSKSGAASGSLPADMLDASGFGGVRGTHISGTSNPAATGAVRLANATDAIVARNAANTGDVTALSVDASDHVILGTLGNMSVIGSVGLNNDTLTAATRVFMPIFFPGALTSTWTAAQWRVIGVGITIRRIELQAKTAPVTCSPNAVIRLTDGSTNIDTTLSAGSVDNISLSTVYAQNADLTLSVQTAAAGCGTSPADVTAIVTYSSN